MTTANDIIVDAAESMGVYSPGETMSAADSSRMLSILNDMLDSWSNESLTTFAKLEQSLVFNPGQYQYTIGPGGYVNATRPLRILDGYGTCYILDTNGNRYPVEVMQQDQWNLIGNITQVNSNIPSRLFYDPQFPLGIINVFPVPNIGWTLFFDSWLQLVEFSGLTTAVSLPPGYVRALKRNLALEAWPYFYEVDKNPPAALVKSAMTALGNIKRTNIKEVVAVFDPEIISRASPTYNIYRDRQGFT